MTEKIYKIVLFLFVIESTFLVIGISVNKITYGSGIATSLTQLGIIFLLFFVLVIRFAIRKFESKLKNGIEISMIVLMLCAMIYFLIENTFKIIM